MKKIIVDTGPLLAFLDRSDHFASWCHTVFAQFSAPFLTCEPAVVGYAVRTGPCPPNESVMVRTAYPTIAT